MKEKKMLRKEELKQKLELDNLEKSKGKLQRKEYELKDELQGMLYHLKADFMCFIRIRKQGDKVTIVRVSNGLMHPLWPKNSQNRSKTAQNYQLI